MVVVSLLERKMFNNVGYLKYWDIFPNLYAIYLLGFCFVFYLIFFTCDLPICMLAVTVLKKGKSRCNMWIY